MKDTEPIEGYFLVTSDKLVFEVKGVIHPNDRRIAYLRYFPTNEFSPRKRRNVYYIKIYDLFERERFLQDNYPKYLWYDSVNDRMFQSVKNEDIEEILNPVKALDSIQDNNGHLQSIFHAAKELSELLISRSGISSKHIGITGSILAGLTTIGSDIDLIVYGEASARQVFETLQIDDEIQSKIRHYEGKNLDEITKFRWGTLDDWMKLRSIERRKVLQGIFHSYPFYIRLVKYPNEFGVKYSDISYKVMGKGSFLCRIIEDNDSIFTPCVYKVDCVDNKKIERIISYRGRFTEQAKCGMVVTARGTLEFVYNHKSDEKFYQIVLGGDSRDFLIPQFI